MALKNILKPNTSSIYYQVLRGTLLGVVVASAILIWLAVIFTPFGYHLAVSYGNSMEPLLRNGDALWLKEVDVTSIKPGDIVTVLSPDEGLITHRLLDVQPRTCCDDYLLETKGDANLLSEQWIISSDTKVEILVARVRYVGYVLEFLRSPIGIALLITIISVLVAILLRRRRMAHTD